MLLPAAYTNGTQRIISPPQTLEKISPFLATMGITRCADITGLDTLGIPTYAAIRPSALSLQVSNGKGLTHSSAKTSALMEAIELYHAEHPEPFRIIRGSLEALELQGTNPIPPQQLPGWFAGGYFTPSVKIDWVEGVELISGTRVMLPASAVYFYDVRPYLVNYHDGSSNGLASGNHPIEASLHALYELIERDAISQISVSGQLRIREWCRVVDLDTVLAPELQGLIDKIHRAQTRLILLWVRNRFALHTFWAILLNEVPLAMTSSINMGYGSHPSLSIAATRAVTEAAQSRLTFIQAAREDLRRHYRKQFTLGGKVYQYFSALKPNQSWQVLEDKPTLFSIDLAQTHARLLSSLEHLHLRVFQCILTQDQFKIPIVKVLIPSFRIDHHLF